MNIYPLCRGIRHLFNGYDGEILSKVSLELDQCLVESMMNRLNDMRPWAHPARYRAMWIHTCCRDIYQYINQIPIYLVEKDMVGMRLPVLHMGGKEITVPEDTFEALDCEHLSSESEEARPSEFVTVTDLWGVYIRRQTGRTGMHCHPRAHLLDHVDCEIFVWADKIYDYACEHCDQDIESYFIALLQQVILHECMHYVMDNFLDMPSRSVFYTVREESLANALSLYLMRNLLSRKSGGLGYSLYQFLSQAVGQQPYQYRIGAKMVEESYLKDALLNWMMYKWRNRVYPCNRAAFRMWLKEVNASATPDLEKMLLLEKAFDAKDTMVIYANHLVEASKVHQIITQDYVLQHSDHCDYSDMLSLFPSCFTGEQTALDDSREGLVCRDGKLIWKEEGDVDIHALLTETENSGMSGFIIV